MAETVEYENLTQADAGTDGPVLMTAPANEDGLDAAAAAARRLIDAMVRLGDGTGYDTDALADRLNALAKEIEAELPDEDVRLVEMWQHEGPNRHDLVTGPENPVAVPLVVHGLPDGSVEGTATLPIAYQGQPRMAHGGISALLIDHTLGMANGWAGRGGMTARLTLNFKRPVPLGRPITINAKQESVDGRKLFTNGTLSVDGEPCVTAEALFIAGHLPRPTAE